MRLIREYRAGKASDLDTDRIMAKFQAFPIGNNHAESLDYRLIFPDREVRELPSAD